MAHECSPGRGGRRGFKQSTTAFSPSVQVHESFAPESRSTLCARAIVSFAGHNESLVAGLIVRLEVLLRVQAGR